MYFNVHKLVTPLCTCAACESSPVPMPTQNSTVCAPCDRCESSRFSISVGRPSGDERISFQISHDLGKAVPTSEYAVASQGATDRASTRNME